MSANPFVASTIKRHLCVAQLTVRSVDPLNKILNSRVVDCEKRRTLGGYTSSLFRVHGKFGIYRPVDPQVAAGGDRIGFVFIVVIANPAIRAKPPKHLTDPLPKARCMA